ncbi:MAG TPA: class IV adenylate cyclase [Holophagaceae bacterium]
MASPLETELKLRIPATAPYGPLLSALGFRETVPAQSESSVLWDRDGELRAAGSALRLRRYAGRARLTWKGPKVPDALLKIRPELETGVEDGAALEGILRALGFVPVMAMEKVRSVWSREELEACLDETPFGCYLELEGDPQAIRSAMESLGLSPDRAEPRSYPELYQAHGLGVTPPR